MNIQGFIISPDGTQYRGISGNDQADMDANTPPGWTFVESDVPYFHVVIAETQNGFTVTEGPARNPDDPVIFAQENGLAALKSRINYRIDTAAETCRLKYITAGSGQAMVYQQKSDEAKAYTAANSPINTDYPLLNAEATATGITVAALAAAVIAVTGQWVALAAQIEGLRMGAKKAVFDAVTIDAVLATEQVDWP